ncbi:hypothetical protein BRARA_F01338 [Brassica rapa]|uniref:CTCHY-type domain-containing protein n=1 Tax=Brassica campestris TaxID=3711 RepID=A0A397YX26_BRACM|nr:hypothetical protein BRARA_F01338 [Brassica rapa]
MTAFVKRSVSSVQSAASHSDSFIKTNGEEADYKDDVYEMHDNPTIRCYLLKYFMQFINGKIFLQSMQKLFDDEREKIGIEYFHCMKCNACMSRTLVEHVCIEKCLEDNCSICHEYIFNSNSPVKALPCGHVMHSTCFQVYFRMLDALLSEQKMPDEYLNQTQAILCNDCRRKGNTPYHWLHHKYSSCASYNTRLL